MGDSARAVCQRWIHYEVPTTKAQLLHCAGGDLASDTLEDSHKLPKH